MSIMIGGKPKIASTLKKEVSSKKDTSTAIEPNDAEKVKKQKRTRKD